MFTTAQELGTLFYGDRRRRPHDGSVQAFGRLIVPILDRYGLPPDHLARRNAQLCIDGTTAVETTCNQAINAGVSLLELRAIIELALREAYPAP
jgi:hypothetical protein